MTTSFNARKTGWTIEDCLSRLAEYDRDPYRHVYYTTYSDIYHTDPDCPHIQNSESLHIGKGVLDLDKGPYSNGYQDPIHLEECSWCATRSDWKFDGHRHAILGGGKTKTIRLGTHGREVSVGDTLVLRDAKGNVFATATVTAVEETTVAAVVRDSLNGHRDYQSIEAFRQAFHEYYPQEQIHGNTKVTIIQWNDVTPRTKDNHD